jgi:hypothetical protein
MLDVMETILNAANKDSGCKVWVTVSKVSKHSNQEVSPLSLSDPILQACNVSFICYAIFMHNIELNKPETAEPRLWVSVNKI